MKRKIALFLAFAMVLSILPMNVFASGDSGNSSLAGQPTGALWERTLGRATNVRHWDPGVLVARPANLNIFRTSNNGMGLTAGNSGIAGDWTDDGAIVPDASGNLRSILASMEYFNPQPNQFIASIGMQIYNARGFMGSLYNDPGFGFESYGFDYRGVTNPPAAVSQDFNDFVAFMIAQATINARPKDASYSVRAAGRDLTQLRSVTTGPALENVVEDALDNITGSNVHDRFTEFQNNAEAFVALGPVAVMLDEITLDDITTDTGALDSDAVEALSDMFFELFSLADSMGINIPGGFLTRSAASIEAVIRADRAKIADLAGGKFTVSGAPQDSGYGIGAPIDWDTRNTYASRVYVFGETVGEILNDIDDAARLLNTSFYRAIWDNTPDGVFVDLPTQLTNMFLQDGYPNSGPRTPIYMSYFEQQAGGANNETGKFMAAILPRYNAPNFNQATTIPNQVDLVLIRTDLDPLLTQASSNATVPRMAVPVEYITNDDTNDNPVRVVYTHRHGGWPQAGDNGSNTTFLTSVTEARFLLSLNDGTSEDAETPRTFHRYGRATVPGIRIAEAVQSSFDQPDWWVEIELITNGFYWTEASTRNIAGDSNGQFVDRISTKYQTIGQNATTPANDIRPINVLTVPDRTPETGNNSFTTLKFPITMSGVTNNLNRQVNDWIQFNQLAIGATDRARNGDVEVEVRLYRLGYDVNTSDGNNYRGHWSWHPYPLAGFGNVDEGSAGREVYGSGPANRLYPQHIPTNTGDATVMYLTRGGSTLTTNNNAGNATNIAPGGTNPNDTVGEFRWQQPPQTGNYGRGSDSVFDGRLVVARFGEIGLELFVHEDDDLEDFQLRSGARDWEYVRDVPVGESRPIGAIVPEHSDFYEHQTVRAVLRETAPGSMPATGAFPTVYNFGEGIQVLGVKLWANEADFSAGHDDSDAEVWFGTQSTEADNFLNASIERNTVTIRPEIGEGANRRWRLAEIWAEFYISIQAGYEHLYGEDIEVTVTSGTVEAPFEQSLVVARTWDPITVETTNIVLDDNAIEAAVGIVRGVDISDITIRETRSGHFSRGQRVWLGFEGGISRGWGSGDHAALRATTVEATGGLQVSPIQHDSHGVYVEITHGSNQDDATIVFKGVQVTGRVVPDEQYNIIVADSAVAHNWEGWAWINALQSDVGFTRGLVRGFFNEEPYITPAFRFEGADVFAPIEIPDSPDNNSSTGNGGGTTTATPPVSFAPQTLREGQPNFSSIRVPGRVFDGPPLILVPNSSNANFQTSYVMLAVVADLLGVEGEWDPATSSGTFSDGVTTVVVTDRSTTATVNGAPRPITASGLPSDARIINDRFYVPMAFFRDVVSEWPVYIQWNDGPVGQRSITVFPQAR